MFLLYKQGLVVVITIFLLTLCISFAEETITISTYYPSPYGSYRELRSQRMAIGDNYIQVRQYCWEGPPTCTNDINDNADLVVEGRVGMGTVNPIGNVGLHLKAIRWDYSTAAGMVIQAATPGDDPGLLFFNSADKDRGGIGVSVSGSGAWSRDASAGDVVLRSARGRIIFATDNTEGPPYGANLYPARMIIDNSGNVGIGTVNPANTRLRVDSGVAMVGNIGIGGSLNRDIWFDGGSDRVFVFYNTASSAGGGIEFNYDPDPPGSGAVLMRINNDGNVGIRTGSPQAPAPNNQAGNLDVNDVYLRSKNKWVSEMGINYSRCTWRPSGRAEGDLGSLVPSEKSDLPHVFDSRWYIAKCRDDEVMAGFASLENNVNWEHHQILCCK